MQRRSRLPPAEIEQEAEVNLDTEEDIQFLFDKQTEEEKNVLKEEKPNDEQEKDKQEEAELEAEMEFFL